MAWISLTADDVKEQIAGPEYDAFQTWHLASGQADPIPDTIEGVVREIRGYVGACERNVLGDSGTIPEELYHSALRLIGWRLALRLPEGAATLQDEGRRQAYEDAIALLERVSRCEFYIEPPTAHSCTPDSSNENSAGRFGGCTQLDFS